MIVNFAIRKFYETIPVLVCTDPEQTTFDEEGDAVNSLNTTNIVVLNPKDIPHVEGVLYGFTLVPVADCVLGTRAGFKDAVGMNNVDGLSAKKLKFSTYEELEAGVLGFYKTNSGYNPIVKERVADGLRSFWDFIVSSTSSRDVTEISNILFDEGVTEEE